MIFSPAQSTKMLTIKDIKEKGWLIFEAIAGSRAYGLAGEESDTDIKGVFILPQHLLYSLDYVPQVTNASNDVGYYELGRFMELLEKNNPGMMEMLNIPGHCILLKHPVMDKIKQEDFLSRLCEQRFANYAYAQVKKAYGLEKKIINPEDGKRKSLLDFCYVYTSEKAVSLPGYLAEKEISQEQLGLSAIDHMKDCYRLYLSAKGMYAGVVKKEHSDSVALSHIPKGEEPVGLLYFNKDAYSVHCKKYKEYREWEAERNPQRYAATIAHGKRYDSKNMMHVFRLLLMAKEIAAEGRINVFRSDRDFLLDIKQGKFEYDDLLNRAAALQAELPSLYAASGLRDEPVPGLASKLLVKMRTLLYEEEKFR